MMLVGRCESGGVLLTSEAGGGSFILWDVIIAKGGKC